MDWRHTTVRTTSRPSREIKISYQYRRVCLRRDGVSKRRITSIHHQHVSGHVRRLVRGEVEGRAGDILGLADPGERHLLRELLQPLRFLLRGQAPPPAKGRLYESRRHRVDAELFDFSQVYQSDLATLGIKLNIQKLELAAWLDQVNNRKYVGLYSTAGTYSQMEAVTQFTNSRGYDPGGNNSGFKSDQYTQLVTQAASEADTAKRKQIYSQLNDLLLDESFITSMAWGPARLGARAAVRDIGFTLHEGLYWTNVWIEG